MAINDEGGGQDPFLVPATRADGAFPYSMGDPSARSRLLDREQKDFGGTEAPQDDPLPSLTPETPGLSPRSFHPGSPGPENWHLWSREPGTECPLGSDVNEERSPKMNLYNRRVGSNRFRGF